MGVHIGATWQIQLNDCPMACTGTKSPGPAPDAASVRFVPSVRGSNTVVVIIKHLIVIAAVHNEGLLYSDYFATVTRL